MSDRVGNYVSDNPLQLGNYVSADTRTVDLTPITVEKIAAMADSYPFPALAVLDQWLANGPDRWSVEFAKASLHEAISVASIAGQTEAELAGKIISLALVEHQVDLRITVAGDEVSEE